MFRRSPERPLQLTMGFSLVAPPFEKIQAPRGICTRQGITENKAYSSVDVSVSGWIQYIWTPVSNEILSRFFERRWSGARRAPGLLAPGFIKVVIFIVGRRARFSFRFSPTTTPRDSQTARRCGQVDSTILCPREPAGRPPDNSRFNCCVVHTIRNSVNSDVREGGARRPYPAIVRR